MFTVYSIKLTCTVAWVYSFIVLQLYSTIKWIWEQTKTTLNAEVKAAFLDLRSIKRTDICLLLDDIGTQMHNEMSSRRKKFLELILKFPHKPQIMFLSTDLMVK